MVQFTTPQLRAFMGLIRLMIGLDKRFSADEASFLESIAEDLGPDEFWKHMEASYEEGLSADEVWELVAGIDDRDVQETIYGNLYELSIAGGIDQAESTLLDRLADQWNLEVTVIAPAAE